MYAQLLSHVRLFASTWTVAHQALSMGFSRQEYWSRLPIPPPGNLSNPGSNPRLLLQLHWRMDSSSLSPPELRDLHLETVEKKPVEKRFSGLVQLFSCSVVSDSLQPHRLHMPVFPVPHHLPVCSNSCPLTQ